MTDLLLPYGCKRSASLVTKAGFGKAATLLPYGSSRSAGLVAKAGIGKVEALMPYGSECGSELVAKSGPGKASRPPSSDAGSAVSELCGARPRRVVRLNSGR